MRCKGREIKTARHLQDGRTSSDLNSLKGSCSSLGAENEKERKRASRAGKDSLAQPTPRLSPPARSAGGGGPRRSPGPQPPSTAAAATAASPARHTCPLPAAPLPSVPHLASALSASPPRSPHPIASAPLSPPLRSPQPRRLSCLSPPSAPPDPPRAAAGAEERSR